MTAFIVASPFIDKYEEHIVGSKKHNELWIPAEDLDELNNNIEGRIKLVNVFYGHDYKGPTPELTIFENKNLVEQFIVWKEILDDSPVNFRSEVKAHWKTVFLNYLYWKQTDFINYGITEKMKSEVLLTMKEHFSPHSI